MKLDRSFLILSTGLNVILIGSIGFLLSAPTETAPVSHAALLEVVAPRPAPSPVGTGFERSSAVPAPASKPLDWAQLESDDYPTYVSNLRKAGLPETTIRNIVSAEVAEDFERQRQEIAGQFAPTEAAKMQKAQRLEQLPRQQTAFVNRLLNSRSVAASDAGANGTAAAIPAAIASVAEPSIPRTLSALLPAALVPIDPQVPLNRQQVSDLDVLGKEFVDGVAQATKGNTSQEDYAARWKAEQEYNDALYRAKFGSMAFVQRSIERMRTSQ